jgi:hypothetical protein
LALLQTKSHMYGMVCIMVCIKALKHNFEQNPICMVWYGMVCIMVCIKTLKRNVVVGGFRLF